jgi:hypothetical protein
MTAAGELFLSSPSLPYGVLAAAKADGDVRSAFDAAFAAREGGLQADYGDDELACSKYLRRGWAIISTSALRSSSSTARSSSYSVQVEEITPRGVNR